MCRGRERVRITLHEPVAQCRVSSFGSGIAGSLVGVRRDDHQLDGVLGHVGERGLTATAGASGGGRGHCVLQPLRACIAGYAHDVASGPHSHAVRTLAGAGASKFADRDRAIEADNTAAHGTVEDLWVFAFVEHDPQSVTRPDLSVVDLAAAAHTDNQAGSEYLLACLGANHEESGHCHRRAHGSEAGSCELQRHAAVLCIDIRVKPSDRDDSTSRTPLPPRSKQQLHRGHRSSDRQQLIHRQCPSPCGAPEPARTPSRLRCSQSGETGSLIGTPAEAKWNELSQPAQEATWSD